MLGMDIDLTRPAIVFWMRPSRLQPGRVTRFHHLEAKRFHASVDKQARIPALIAKSLFARLPPVFLGRRVGKSEFRLIVYGSFTAD